MQPIDRPSRPRPAWRAVLTLCLSASLLGGCASVRTTGSYPTQGELGGLEVRVFADPESRRAARLGPLHVVGELERKTADGSWEPVFRALRPGWTVLDLPPGRYRLLFPAVLDADGHELLLSDVETTLRIRGGEITQVEAVLERGNGAAVAVGVAAAVVAVVLLHEWLDDHDFDPPRPPRVLEELAAEALFHVTLGLALEGAFDPGRPNPAPVITSHFPEHGALVAAARPRIVLAASEPLGPETIYEDSVRVFGDRSGSIPGTVRYDPDSWWILWEPDEPLPPGEVFDVVLDADGVRDLEGRRLADEVRFSFETPG